MLVMMNFSMNVDHALSQEKLSLGYMETAHSELSPEEMDETESEDEKRKKRTKESVSLVLGRF